MRKSKHCSICANCYRDSNRGIMCGITNQKPKFGNKCDKIDLSNERLLQLIEMIYLEYQLERRNRRGIVWGVVWKMGAGLLLLIVGAIYHRILFDPSVFFILLFAVMCLEIGIFTISIRPLVLHLQQIRGAKKRMKELKDVLSLYGMEYKVDMEIYKGVHELLDVETTVEIIKNGQTIYSDYQAGVYTELPKAPRLMARREPGHGRMEGFVNDWGL